MNNIYQTAIKTVEGGANFKVDFLTRSLKLNGKFIIQDGQYDGEPGDVCVCEEEFCTNVEELYHRYKHSVPSQRSESKSRQYFVALAEKDLDDEAMLYGERRDKAQIELELYILCQILSGFKWNDKSMGKWFWQSKTDKDLVMLRNWIEPENV